ncbi:MAG: hypothetical protein QF535_18145 [Anaerolineales bacterium]|jgi:hypothetical protein|nr:hypothetical protein [Anaerolineales bacterium]|tara:strand:- start:78 stop:638 length:561 start_codon:yes stop_codon:yes gene_type:complete
MKQLKNFFSIYVIAIVLVIALVASVNCGNSTSPQIVDEAVHSEETTTSNLIDPAIPVLQSNLEITQLELGDYGNDYDSRLWGGDTFSILVQVINHGQTASGEYMVGIWQELDPNTLKYECCGIFTKVMLDSYTMDSLAPGEMHTVKKENAILNLGAWYTISAEITPIGWQERNNSRHVESLDVEVW